MDIYGFIPNKFKNILILIKIIDMNYLFLLSTSLGVTQLIFNCLILQESECAAQQSVFK